MPTIYFQIIFIYLRISTIAIAVSDAPVIAVDGKSIVDFGAYPAKERKVAFYKIINKGNSILKIKKVRKTCGCAEVVIDKRIIKPGGFATVKAVILEDSIYSAYSKNFYIESNDPKQRLLTLTIRGNAIPILKIKPKANMYIGYIPVEKKWSQEFLVEISQSGVRLKEPVLVCNTRAHVILRKKSDKLFQLKVFITPEKGQTTFKCEIKLPIVAPKGWKTPKILITGKIR